MSIEEYKHVSVEYVSEHVIEVKLNRPEKRNAMNKRLWQEIGDCFANYIPFETKCRCVVLSGAGDVFSAGIDLGGAGLSSVAGLSGDADAAEAAIAVLREGGNWQSCWRAINQCTKPVIACIQKGCYGAALELVAFCDIRMCTKDAVFQAPEVDIGLAADIGGNQMLPKILGNDSLVRELMMSGRKMSADEAFTHGLVSRVCDDHEKLRAAVMELAETIASKSPVATVGVKTMLNFARDHSVETSMQYSLAWNSAMTQTKDLQKAGMAFAMKKRPVFGDISPLSVKSKL